MSGGQEGFRAILGKYHIVSLANSADKGAFVRQLLAKPGHKFIELCGGDVRSKFDDVPGMQNYPWRQDDCARFTNYYAQTVLDTVWCRCTLPNAIYIDMVTTDGSIDIGNDHKFGYVDTILAYNALQSKDRNVTSAMMWRRSLLPLRRWEDRQNGRSAVWPLTT